MSMETGTYCAFKPKPVEPMVVVDESAKIEEIEEEEKGKEAKPADGATNGVEHDDDAETGGWGAADGTFVPGSNWGEMNADFDAGEWGAPTATGGTGTWEQPAPTWDLTEEHYSLTSYYPALPDSHVLVRVESGVRKILSVEAPLPTASSEFRRPVGVVVMAPWPEHKKTETTATPFPKMMLDDVSEEVVSIPAHDPIKDNIRVYVDPKTADRLKGWVGLGFNGYWMQVAMKQTEEATSSEPPVETDASTEKKSKSQKKDEKDSAACWWYCDDTFQTLQSYWTET